MMKILRWTLMICSFLAVTTTAYGATPTFMPVQGFLTDASGTPVDGAVILNFSLYDEVTALAPIWTETQNLELTQGLLVSYLGMTFPLAPGLFADHHDLWLGVVVGSDPEMPRVRLGSIPFAAYAQTCGETPAHTHGVDDLTGVVAAGQSCAVGEVVTGFDAVGVPLCAPMPTAEAPPTGGGGYALSGQTCPFGQFVSGISAAGGLICEPAPSSGGGGAGDGVGIQGSGTAKRIPVFKNSDTLEDSMIIEYNNKIGINITNPGRTLEVKGDLEVSGDFYWGGEAFSSSSCVVMGGTSCSTACSKHGMTCYKAFAIDGDSDKTTCSQSGFKFCCCK